MSPIALIKQTKAAVTRNVENGKGNNKKGKGNYDKNVENGGFHYVKIPLSDLTS